MNQLRAAAESLQGVLRQYSGVYDIENSAQGSIPELNLRINASGEALGLTLQDLATQVRAAFYGVEAQRIQRGGEEIRVMVRYPEHERKSLGNLESMFIRTADGREVPFSSVATVEERSSPTTILRIDGDRTVEVSANVDVELVDPGRINQDVLNGDFRR
ncbi:MAG: efflux RND transporter permease subunit, partial [Gammaproteobacteria bacterium]